MDNRLPSNRKFGLFLIAVFSFLGFYSSVVYGSYQVGSALLGLSVIFSLATIFRPDSLQSLNVYWAKLGFVLGKIVNPLVMTVLYCFLICVLGVFYRVFRVDPLRLKTSPKEDSYWIRCSKGPKDFDFTSRG